MWHRSQQACGGQVLVNLKKSLIFQLMPSRDVMDFPLKRNSGSCDCTMHRQWKAHDGIEERMQSANKAWWRDVKIYRSKDKPWRFKCRRMVEHVYSVFSCGSDNWTLKTSTESKGWETQATMKHGLIVTREPAERPGRYG